MADHERTQSNAASAPQGHDPQPSAERSSRPSVRLVPTPREDGTVPLSAVKGAAPGVYHPGAPALPPGARVGILCDTLHGDPEVGLDYAQGLASAVELIESLGYEAVIDDVHARVEPYYGRWAGSVEERAAHFRRLLDEHAVDAVFPLFGKGGFHAVVDAVADSSYRPARPVVLIGGFSHHSDWSLFGQSEKGRWFFSHLINATQCAYWKMLPAENVDNLQATLHRAEAVEYGGLVGLNAAAEAEVMLDGRLAGGNLSAILRNLGKPWCPDFADRIVVCEDYDQHPHEIHFRATELLRTMELYDARAVVFGAVLPQKRPAYAKLDAEARRAAVARDAAEIDSILREAASHVRFPVYTHAGLCSHGAMNYPLGYGGLALLTGRRNGSARLYNRLEVL